MAKREALPPEVYARVFEGHHEGQQILEELQAIFCRGLWVRGEEGRRETDYRLGRNAVINFIMNRISVAGGAPDDEEEA